MAFSTRNMANLISKCFGEHCTNIKYYLKARFAVAGNISEKFVETFSRNVIFLKMLITRDY